MALHCRESWRKTEWSCGGELIPRIKIISRAGHFHPLIATCWSLSESLRALCWSYLSKSDFRDMPGVGWGRHVCQWCQSGHPSFSGKSQVPLPSQLTPAITERNPTHPPVCAPCEPDLKTPKPPGSPRPAGLPRGCLGGGGVPGAAGSAPLQGRCHVPGGLAEGAAGTAGSGRAARAAPALRAHTHTHAHTHPHTHTHRRARTRAQAHAHARTHRETRTPTRISRHTHTHAPAPGGEGAAGKQRLHLSAARTSPADEEVRNRPILLLLLHPKKKKKHI